MTTYLNPDTTVLAQGLIDTGMNLTGQLEVLIKAGLIVIVLGAIAFTMVKSRMAAAAVAGAILVGGAAIWGVTNIDVIGDRVGEDLSAPQVVLVDSTSVSPLPGL